MPQWDEAAMAMVAELPGHQRNVVLFALATELRQPNVMRLEWPQVEVERNLTVNQRCCQINPTFRTLRSGFLQFIQEPFCDA